MHARISGLGTRPVCHMTNLLWAWSESMRAPTLVSILCIILRYGLGSNRAGFLDLSYKHAEYVGQSRYTSTYRQEFIYRSKGKSHLTYLGWQVLGAEHRYGCVLELNGVESPRNLETSFHM